MAGAPLNAALAPLYVAAGQANHIPPEVLAGVADVESNQGGNASTSSTGAQGTMQFEPGTAAQFHNDPGHNPRNAIFDAAKLLNQYGYQHNPLRAIGAYNGGPGNPQMGYANQVMAQANRLKGPLSSYLSGKGNMNLPSNAATPSQTQTTTTPGSTDWADAGIQAFLSEANKPISSTGKVSISDPLGHLIYNSQQPAYQTPASTKSVVLPGQNNRINVRPGAGNVGPGGNGDVNPIHGATIGRTDMGVDANLPIGHPIVAMNDSRVVKIIPNWYNGQPLVMMTLTAGPNKGKSWYVAEQITGLPHVGQLIFRGQTVVRYAGNGTGIEIGWGDPSGQTLAQAQGNTGDPSHNNAPAGVAFRRELHSLGA